MDEEKTAKIAFVTDKKEAADKLAAVLRETEVAAECQLCPTLDDLKAFHSKTRCELVAYWHKSSKVADKDLFKFLKAAPDPPGLVLVSDNPAAGDYVQAASLAAADVINSELVAHIPFVILREIKNNRIRRKYRRAMKKLEEEHVVDITDFEMPKDEEGMPELVTTIDEALKSNQMELLFQPILAVQNDGYDNYEVFLRIKKKDGYIMPDDFMPIAEQYGLMPAIDRWVVKSALTRFRAEQEVRRLKKDSKRELRFFINISGHSLVDEVIMGSIISEIVKAKLDPGSFVIEVHKNTILSRLQKAKSLNQNIKKLKLEFAIDHYDESDSSLNYLKHIALDYIKLNRDLMRNVRADPAKRDSVREIVAKAHENNIKVIASQVEDALVLPTLYDVGVDYIQGFLIAEPGTRLERAVIDASLDEAE